MPFHHLALATRDTRGTHLFYTRAMGFELVKVVVSRTPADGWSKHFFYDTGAGELIAFWELHDESLPAEFPTALSTGAGLPEWVNHVAFGARDPDDLDARRRRLVEHGYDVMEIDHGWCRSIYTLDPNRTMVEFCTSLRPFDEEERRRAEALLFDPEPPLEDPADPPRIYRGEGRPLHRRADVAG